MESSKKKNQYDVRATGDLVSLFRNPFQTGKEQTDILDKKKGVIYGDKKFYVN